MASRKRKCSTNFEEGSHSSNQDNGTPKDDAKKEYSLIINNTINAITERSSQASTDTYNALSRLVKNAIDGNKFVIPETIAKLYCDDFNFDDMEKQLGLVHFLLADTSVLTIKKFAAWLLATPRRADLKQVEKLVTLLLTLPATNACNRRSSSALEMIKTYLRSSMSPGHLNSCMALHVYKEKTDMIDPKDVIREFVERHPDKA